MNSKQLFIILFISFVAASFYLLPGKNQRRPVADWSSVLPSYITDSIYLDANNSYDKKKIELGRYLFYDRRLSFNKSKSCASCHDPKFSFTDGYRRSIGASGDLHQRNSTPLINLIYKKYLTAADSALHYPEQQINNPMFHDNPVELGWKGNETEMLRRINEDGAYSKLFKDVFEDEADPISIINIRYSIAAFIKTIISSNSPYDRFYYRKEDAINLSAKRGMQLFFSNELGCYNCHGGFDFATPIVKDSAGKTEYYFNTGLYNIDDKGDYPAYDKGLKENTNNQQDVGKYRVASLRNLAFTAPYYHDGSTTTLEEVVKNYENGGRNIRKGEAKGNGIANPYKSKLVNGFILNEEQRRDLIQFLLSLSDSSILKNDDYANPFGHDETN